MPVMLSPSSATLLSPQHSRMPPALTAQADSMLKETSGRFKETSNPLNAKLGMGPASEGVFDTANRMRVARDHIPTAGVVVVVVGGAVAVGLSARSLASWAWRASTARDLGEAILTIYLRNKNA